MTALYHVSDLAPNINVHLIIGGREVLGQKVQKHDRRLKRLVIWYRVKHEGQWREDLPENATPVFWKPIKDTYPYKLPDPVSPWRIQSEVAWQSSPVPPRRPKPKSMDVEMGRYSERPNISEHEAEIRMIRAIRTECVTPNRGVDGMKVSEGLNALADWAAENIDAEAPERWEPTPRDVTDAEICMAWFARLNPPEFTQRYGETVYLQLGPLDRKPNRYQAALVWRAIDPPVQWKRIADALGCSEPTAQRYYERSLEAIADIANGRSVGLFKSLGIRVKDQMQMVRERNRVHALRGYG